MQKSESNFLEFLVSKIWTFVILTRLFASKIFWPEQVLKVRELEEFNMNRRVSGPRKAYVKTFLEWMDKNGAKIDGVEVAEFGDQGKVSAASGSLWAIPVV